MTIRTTATAPAVLLATSAIAQQEPNREQIR